MAYKNRIIYIASELKQNFKVLVLSGMLAVVNMVQPIDTLATVYNFEVEQTHNYYVGTEGVVVSLIFCKM